MENPTRTRNPSTERGLFRAGLTGWAGAGLLLLVSYLIAVSAAMQKCATADEPLHLAGGYGYWVYGDYRFQPENGNWPQRLAALPLLGRHYRFDEDEEIWRKGDMVLAGRAFLYELGNPAEEI